jgi:phospholipase A1
MRSSSNIADCAISLHESLFAMSRVWLFAHRRAAAAGRIASVWPVAFLRLWRRRQWSLLGIGLLSAAATQAQNTSAIAPALPTDGSASWQQCQRLADDDAQRLACYDRWARQQTATPTNAPPALATDAAPQSDDHAAAAPAEASAESTAANEEQGCHDRQFSLFSRFWELEKGSSCGTFGLRGYRPLDISFSVANKRPATPTSPARDHTATPQDYQPYQMRINLSLRTKLAQNLFTRGLSERQDSLWFGYSQQSDWQVFNVPLSRPFRSTDHEPELIYVYPLDKTLPGGWRWRYAGLGLVHQSNGQSLPLSRSWNRLYLMGGIELDDRWHFTARAWQRIRENAADDDNPDIAHYIGRAELGLWWTPDKQNSYGITARTFGRGSMQFDWLRALSNSDKNNLRLHMRLFSGYGDTLVEYNQRRTVFSIGLSLVDF